LGFHGFVFYALPDMGESTAVELKRGIAVTEIDSQSFRKFAILKDGDLGYSHQSLGKHQT
jgi:hypothetical protein